MTRFRFGNLQYFFRPCASSKPNGYTFPKVNEIIPYFCRRLHLHPIFFVKREILFFSPSPLRGKVEKSISPRKIKGETHIRPSRKRPNLSFHKMPSPSTAPTASDRSRASARSRGRFLPLFAARRSYANRRPSPPQSAPQPLCPSCTSLPRSCPFDSLQPTKSAAARPLIHCGVCKHGGEGEFELVFAGVSDDWLQHDRHQ